MKMTHLTIAALAVAGCASTSPRPSFEETSKLVQDRGGKRLYWDEGTPADAQVQAHVRDLLHGTLTPDGAVEVALLRNQRLVATYEELGVAQADLVQAGLLRNPTLGARVRFPTGAGLTAAEFSVAEDFLGIFTLPMRKRVAAAQLDAAKARVGSAVLDLNAEVRTAFVTLQAAQATANLRQLMFDAQQAAAELRRRQHAAGNVGDLELVQEEAFYQQAKLDLARAQTLVLEQRERVNRLLGLWGEESSSWKVSDELPALPAAEPPLEHVESLAVARRLDLAAAHSDAQALEQAASAAGITRFIPALEVGVSTERDAEGTRVTGPSVAIEIPLFDQGQARVARLAAQIRQARARAAELAVNIRAEVRGLRTRLIATRGVVDHYRTVLLPLRERVVQHAQLRYNSMLLGVFQLLLARREQIDAYRDYLDSVRDYWTARADLERAAGGSLTAALPQEKKP
jgi:cobalt-zinc-cadmium efflux system outer membrane protein